MKGNKWRESSHQENNGSEITGMAENEEEPQEQGCYRQLCRLLTAQGPSEEQGKLKPSLWPVKVPDAGAALSPRERHHSLCVKTLSTWRATCLPRGGGVSFSNLLKTIKLHNVPARD